MIFLAVHAVNQRKALKLGEPGGANYTSWGEIVRAGSEWEGQTLKSNCSLCVRHSVWCCMPRTILCAVIGELYGIISFHPEGLSKRATVVHVSQSDPEMITC